MKRIIGGISIILGIIGVIRVGYYSLIDIRPEVFDGKPIPALLASAIFISVGTILIRKTATRARIAPIAVSPDSETDQSRLPALYAADCRNQPTYYSVPPPRKGGIWVSIISVVLAIYGTFAGVELGSRCPTQIDTIFAQLMSVECISHDERVGFFAVAIVAILAGTISISMDLAGLGLAITACILSALCILFGLSFT